MLVPEDKASIFEGLGNCAFEVIVIKLNNETMHILALVYIQVVLVQLEAHCKLAIIRKKQLVALHDIVHCIFEDRLKFSMNWL